MCTSDSQVPNQMDCICQQKIHILDFIACKFPFCQLSQNAAYTLQSTSDKGISRDRPNCFKIPLKSDAAKKLYLLQKPTNIQRKHTKEESIT
jgi:hypothetical protein